MASDGRDTTEHRFLRSSVAAYLGQLGRMLLSFAARLVLARLILPEGHGLYELALRIVTVAAACRDLGIPYQLMRDPRRPYGTVLASTLVLGLVVTVALIGVAPAFAVLTPELPAVLRGLAVWVLLDALAVVPRTFFERELRIGRLLAPELGRAAVLAVVSIALAWRGFGVWAFVLGDLAAALVLAAWLWWRARGEIPLALRLDLLPDLVRRSFYLFLIWIAMQVVTYLDIYVIQVFGDTATVGLYARAYFIAFLVQSVAAPRALFPALVEYQHDPERFAGAFRLGTAVLLSLEVTAGYFLFFNAEKVVLLLLGPAWSGAAPLLRVLCFVPFLDPFTKLGGEVLKARHEDRVWLLSAVLNLVSLLAVGVLLTRRLGAPGMAAANYLVAGNLLMAWRIYRILGHRFRALAGDLVLVYALPLPLFVVAAALTPPGSWPRFAGSAAAAAIAGLLLGGRFYRPFRKFFAARPAGPATR